MGPPKTHRLALRSLLALEACDAGFTLGEEGGREGRWAMDSQCPRRGPHLNPSPVPIPIPTPVPGLVPIPSPFISHPHLSSAFPAPTPLFTPICILVPILVPSNPCPHAFPNPTCTPSPSLSPIPFPAAQFCSHLCFHSIAVPILSPSVSLSPSLTLLIPPTPVSISSQLCPHPHLNPKPKLSPS